MNSLKQKLQQACLSYVEDRLASLEAAIKNIQQSANEETKSTAGDKYETGRAMAQLEIDKHQSQRVELVKMKHELLRIPVADSAVLIKPGSLVFTSHGNYFIAIPAGKQQVDNDTFFVVSVGSPIAQKLLGLAVGEVAILNQQEIKIQEIQ